MSTVSDTPTVPMYRVKTKVIEGATCLESLAMLINAWLLENAGSVSPTGIQVMPGYNSSGQMHEYKAIIMYWGNK
jgi:hypothetical protein